MADLRRLPVKYIRDLIKKDYKAREACHICGNLENIELHHLYSISSLFYNWCVRNNVSKIETVEQINAVREPFIRDNAEALANDNLYSLCKKHHLQLHNIYGQDYDNSLAPKVKRWLEIQREKHGNSS